MISGLEKLKAELRLLDLPMPEFMRIGSGIGIIFKDIAINTVPLGISEIETDSPITWFGITNSNVSKLPQFIGELTDIKTLHLSNCNFSEIPEIIRNFPDLLSLDMAHNQITIIPDWIGEFENLRNLYLHNNKIKAIPDTICNLPKLESFYINNNNISQLPECIGNLTTLDWFYIDDNPIHEFPETLETGSYRRFTYSNTPIKNRRVREFLEEFEMFE